LISLGRSRLDARRSTSHAMTADLLSSIANAVAILVGLLAMAFGGGYCLGTAHAGQSGGSVGDATRTNADSRRHRSVDAESAEDDSEFDIVELPGVVDESGDVTLTFHCLKDMKKNQKIHKDRNCRIIKKRTESSDQICVVHISGTRGFTWQVPNIKRWFVECCRSEI
jgi:hypothetical protein